MTPIKSLMALEGLSQEAISFQSSDFFNELTEAIAQAWSKNFKLSYFELIKQPEIKNIPAVIKKHTGLNIEYSLEGPGDPAIIAAPVTPDNILYDQFRGEHPEILLRVQQNTKNARVGFVKGTVDYKKARVTGYFAELKHELWMPVGLLTNGREYFSTFTPDEVAAILIHETGHGYTFLEVLVRTVSTNYVLGWMSAVRSDSAPEEYKIAIEKFGRKENWTPEQVSAFQEAKSTEDLAVLSVANMWQKARSEIGLDYYDSTTCEQMADQFAARFGAGRSVITGLEKMGGFNPRHARNKHFYVWQAIVRAGVYTLGVMAAPWFAATVLLFDVLEVAATAGLPNAGSYDNDQGRVARVRNEMIHQLKTQKLSSEKKAQLIKDIEFLTQIEQRVVDHPGLHQKIALLISSSYSKKYNFMQLQKNLEALAASGLYVKAEKISSLIQ